MSAKGRGRGKTRDPQGVQAPAHAQSGAPRGGMGGGPSYAQMGGGSAAAPPQAPQSRPPASAWGPPGGASARATHRPPTAQPAQALSAGMEQMSLGRPAPAGGSGGNGNGHGAGGPAGRGSVRGKRPIEGSLTVTRPKSLTTKQGKDGKPLGLLANYFKLPKLPTWTLRRYRVDISPEEDRTRERQNLLRVHRELLGGYLFDGTVLYTINPITSVQNDTLTLTSHDREKTKIYTLTVRGAGEVADGDYAYVQVFNLLLRSCISSLDLSLVGRDYYDTKAKVEVPKFRLELWPGYKTSIRQHEKDILMCVEITHKVMRMETALDILNDCYQRNPDQYKRDFMKEVIGCIVLTKYNNKTYRIDDVDWQTRPGNTFKYRDEMVTYAAYMERKYQVQIRDMKQPMLVSRAKARDVRAGMQEIVNLIPEVCHLTGLTDNMRSNFQLMKALGEHTKVSPGNRITKLLAFNKRLHDSPQAMAQLQRFEMSLDKDLVRVPGREAVSEKIFLGMGRSVPSGPSVEWNKDLSRSPLLLPKELRSWVFIVPSKWRRDASSFAQTLGRVGSGMKFNIAPPEYVEIQRDNAAEYAQALSQILDRNQPQLIMCAVPNNRGDRYAVIKKKCCVDRAVPTQVIQTKNLNDPKKTTSIATKVAIQLNCKIGGAPWSVEVPLGDLMVIGFDVCHDTSSKSQSFGAMVASLDKPMTRYFSAVTPHNSGEELSNNLALNIVKALRKYSEVNGQLPGRILIYRDGVGEGQIPYVYSTELEAIKAKLSEVYGGPGFKMTFVIVTKRINTRLFTENGQNPPPGTIVDDVVTDPEKYDFFLVSQSVREGTVSPTSFNVLCDGIALPCDRLQRLSYKMCHMYFNWSGTVRVPAQCQYAHKLAFLVGQSLHREPQSQLEDLLYFL